eukprot:CAMPEP_0194074830 /NCGR_PEP_ID=MMETSP0149-20130528/1895_1 /TAXON_ID=122233 /ORGANISM="Chaetoceros debilis, Strain MM31A-1" /LENGTH=50 /DNA_ID=CAMNT_0038755117 /DNA_START=280 /DNA_END=429 /DNA_ORIENTATION=-
MASSSQPFVSISINGACAKDSEALPSSSSSSLLPPPGKSTSIMSCKSSSS